MLQSLKKMYGKTVAAADGEIGPITDFYFEDRTWMVRYMVVDTGPWLAGRTVLLSPHAFAKLDAVEETVPARLLKQQIENSPPLEPQLALSRQYETEYHRYYGWPAYWESAATPGPSALPLLAHDGSIAAKRQQQAKPQLRSARGAVGYYVETSKAGLGQLNSFLADDRSWMIRELLVTGGHGAGMETLISVNDVEEISDEGEKIRVGFNNRPLPLAPAIGPALSTAKA